VDRSAMGRFGLSSRELRVLALAVGAALLVLVCVRVVRRAFWEPEVEVQPTRETLQAPPRLDLNAAGEADLMLLPGIGEHTARAIAAYRAEHGPFERLEDLQKVRGVGPATLERLRPHLMCRPAPKEGKP